MHLKDIVYWNWFLTSSYCLRIKCIIFPMYPNISRIFVMYIWTLNSRSLSKLAFSFSNLVNYVEYVIKLKLTCLLWFFSIGVIKFSIVYLNLLRIILCYRLVSDLTPNDPTFPKISANIKHVFLSHIMFYRAAALTLT